MSLVAQTLFRSLRVTGGALASLVESPMQPFMELVDEYVEIKHKEIERRKNGEKLSNEERIRKSELTALINDRVRRIQQEERKQ